MWTCPVCKSSGAVTLCRNCGFDGSTDYSRYPTLTKIAGIRKTVKIPTDIRRCAACNGIQFYLSASGDCCTCVTCGQQIALQPKRAAVPKNAEDPNLVPARQELVRTLALIQQDKKQTAADIFRFMQVLKGRNSR